MLSTRPVRSDTDKTIIKAFVVSRKFIKDHPEIILTRADKGNVTVAMDKIDYVSEMNLLLSDRSTYDVVHRDPTNKITNELHTLLMRWKSKKYISHITYRNLNNTNGIIPRAYGLPKIHKEGNPLRIIVSSIDSTLYSLSNYLHKIIYNNIPMAESNVRNSFQLVKKLRGTRLEEHHKLASLDVISLFTNVPIDLALTGFRKRWVYIKNGTNIPLPEFLIALRLVLNSTYFMFDGLIYRQIFGTPMGSPLSPIVADIVMRDLEEKAIKRIPIKLPFYFRYVDDILLAAPLDFVDDIKNIFNSFHRRLQFTVEVAHMNTISFLDVTLKSENGILEFDWYHKPTFSGRYLNYASHHPTCHKIGTIYSLVDKWFLLSHPKYHHKNFNLILDILIDNGYPPDFLFRMIVRRIKLLISRMSVSPGVPSSTLVDSRDNINSFFPIPFVNKISDLFGEITKKLDTRLAFRGIDRLDSIIKTHKDKLPPDKHCNVVYKMNCIDCDVSYVGQTSRKLSTRVAEHKRINRNFNSVNGVVTEHRLRHNHDFDWSKAEILKEEKNFFKRSVIEMLYIQGQSNGINLKTDTEALGDHYTTILRNIL